MAVANSCLAGEAKQRAVAPLVPMHDASNLVAPVNPDIHAMIAGKWRPDGSSQKSGSPGWGGMFDLPTTAVNLDRGPVPEWGSIANGIPYEDVPVRPEEIPDWSEEETIQSGKREEIDPLSYLPKLEHKNAVKELLEKPRRPANLKRFAFGLVPPRVDAETAHAIPEWPEDESVDRTDEIARLAASDSKSATTVSPGAEYVDADAVLQLIEKHAAEYEARASAELAANQQGMEIESADFSGASVAAAEGYPARLTAAGATGFADDDDQRAAPAAAASWKMLDADNGGGGLGVVSGKKTKLVASAPSASGIRAGAVDVNHGITVQPSGARRDYSAESNLPIPAVDADIMSGGGFPSRPEAAIGRHTVQIPTPNALRPPEQPDAADAVRPPDQRIQLKLGESNFGAPPGNQLHAQPQLRQLVEMPAMRAQALPTPAPAFSNPAQQQDDAYGALFDPLPGLPEMDMLIQ